MDSRRRGALQSGQLSCPGLTPISGSLRDLTTLRLASLAMPRPASTRRFDPGGGRRASPLVFIRVMQTSMPRLCNSAKSHGWVSCRKNFLALQLEANPLQMTRSSINKTGCRSERARSLAVQRRPQCGGIAPVATCTAKRRRLPEGIRQNVICLNGIGDSLAMLVISIVAVQERAVCPR
jgi:hypothetical protein